MTEKETGERIALSLLPDAVKSKASTNVITYNFITVGEVKMPNGQKLREFSWAGTLPGAKAKNYPFVKKQHWKSPKSLIKIFESWRKKGTSIILMLTETPLYCEVFLSAFEHTFSGGTGDVQYSISFTERKPVKIYTILEAKQETAKSDNNIDSSARPATQKPNTDTQTNSAQTKSYTVKSGDTLWDIAQKHLGAGSRWQEIYNLNKSVIGSDPAKIRAGQTFVLPS